MARQVRLRQAFRRRAALWQDKTAGQATREQAARFNGSRIFPCRLRHEKWNRLASVPAVNLKVVVQGEHHRLRMQFCQPDKTGVGEGHRHVCVSLNELLQSGAFRNYREINAEQPAVDELKEFCGSVGQFASEKECFGQNGFTGQEWRGEALKLFDDPLMVAFFLDQKSNQWACVNNNPRLRHPNPPSISDSWRGLRVR